MIRPKIRFITVIYIIAFILADLFIYWFLALLFMGYTDFYDESEGPWMSLESMTTKEKIIYFAIDFWYVVNIALIIWTCFKIYKWYKHRRSTSNIP
jgi:hypothetical protein